MTLSTAAGFGVGICAGAAALIAFYHMGDAHFLLCTLAGFHKVNGHIGIDIAAPVGGICAGSGAPAAAETTESAAENAVENIAYISKSAETTESACTCAAAIVGIYAGMAELIIACPFFRIREHLIGLVDFLELFSCFLVIRVQIGVIFPGHAFKGFLDFVLRSTFFQPQHFIIIPFFCHVCWLLSEKQPYRIGLLVIQRCRDKPKPAPSPCSEALRLVCGSRS